MGIKDEKSKSTFEDLEVWKSGRKLRSEISNLTKTFPKEESYLLTNQMIRASRSVTANISEGYGRFHYQENIQFCRQARGSLFELLDHLTVALDERYIDKSKFTEFKKQIFEVIRTLNGYIKYLKGRKDTSD
jgi:four helix bundle protein